MSVPMPTLHPRFADPAVMADLRRRWQVDRCMRVDELMRPGLAQTLADAALAMPFEFYQLHSADIRCVMWRNYIALPDEPGGSSNFVHIDEAAQLVVRDIPALASAITGRALRRPAINSFSFDCYRKGCYLDPHTDQGPQRVLAYVVGLTRDVWPADKGGHLEFIGADGGQDLTERRAPGWDTLDLYNMYPILRWHQIPVIQDHVVRLTTNGWMTGAVQDPWEGSGSDATTR